MSSWRNAARELPSAKNLDRTTLNDHIPALLNELADILQAGIEKNNIRSYLEGLPLEHGIQRLQNGFQVEELVAEYNLLRVCIHDLAEANGIDIKGELLRIFHYLLDTTINSAVRTFAIEQAVEIRTRREDYLAFVAHDLRTPLSAISLVASIMEKKVSGTTDIQSQQLIKTLQRNTGYLTRLVSSILQENTNIETESGVRIECRFVDLWPLIEGLIHDLHPVAGTASAAIVNDVPEDLIIFADATLLKRIFQNLIANALKYAPDGSIVISASYAGDDRTVSCRVWDNGQGISPERLATIFEKFETDRHSPDSVGLGLTICKTFVEAHGGTINASSDKENGTTFEFTIPGK